MKKQKDAKREVLEIIVAFFIAWLAYQFLALVTGTPLPVVSVVSDSMYHTAQFDEWWGANGRYYGDYSINKDGFRSFIAPNGLSRGDLLLVVRPDEPRIGDVLIYRRPGSDFTIVHRLVKTEKDFYVTKGDNNIQPDQPVAKQYVVGKVVFAVPILGYPRLVLHLVGI